MALPNYTERIVILATPAQKAELTERARAAGTNVGDFVRSTLFQDQPRSGVVESLQGQIDELRTRVATLEKRPTKK